MSSVPRQPVAAGAPAVDPAIDPALERLTVRRYLLGMTAQGVWWAGYVLLPFVLAKSLAAPGWMVTAAATLETSGMLLALYWGQLLQQGGRRRWLVRAGLGGRAVLLLALLVRGPWSFLALLVPVHFFASLVYPAQNAILQANIRADRHGRVFGRGALIQHLTAAATSVAVGHVLRGDPSLYRLVYPVIGVVGFGYPWLLARLPRPAGDTTPDPDDVFSVPRLPLGPVRWRRLAGALAAPLREAAAVFRRDRPFLWYEANFMVYGLAYMMLVPVVPLFFTRELHLRYDEIANARVLIASLGVALLGPTAGRLMDRIDPVRLSAAGFAVLSLYPLSLAAGAVLGVTAPATTAYLAFALYALGMAAINVTWNVGSISFAPPGRGGYYQGIHVAMVGVRGVFGPAIGFVVQRLFGYRQVFLAAAALFLLAAGGSWALGRWRGTDQFR